MEAILVGSSPIYDTRCNGNEEEKKKSFDPCMGIYDLETGNYFFFFVLSIQRDFRWRIWFFIFTIFSISLSNRLFEIFGTYSYIINEIYNTITSYIPLYVPGRNAGAGRLCPAISFLYARQQIIYTFQGY